MGSKSFSNHLQKRLKTFQKLLKEKGIEICVIEHPTDVGYLTGFHASLVTLTITQSGCRLFVDGRYTQAAKESGLPIADYGDASLKKIFGKYKKGAFDSAMTSFTRGTHLRKLARGAGLTLAPWKFPLQEVRLFKDPQEIAALKKSAVLNARGFSYIKGLLRPGVTEKELCRALEIFFIENGGEGFSFEPIIAFGKNSALPHYHSGDTPYKEGDIALFDQGVIVDGYASDMTRTLLPKNPDQTQKQLYETVLASYAAAASLCRPGVKLGALDRSAREVMAKEGLEKLYVHSLGHGIGIDVHEYPRLKFDGVDKNVTLKPGMVITIEPGLYLPGKGGVRYENTVIVGGRGHTNLYPDV